MPMRAMLRWIAAAEALLAHGRVERRLQLRVVIHVVAPEELVAPRPRPEAEPLHADAVGERQRLQSHGYPSGWQRRAQAVEHHRYASAVPLG